MKSHLEPVVNSETNSKSVKSYKRFRSKKYQSDNQQKCIDCLKPRSKKMSVSLKNVVAITFMCPIIKVFHFSYCSFCSV